jgi:hypothetical protein
MSSDKGLDKEFMKATVGGDGVPRSSSCIAFISILPMNDRRNICRLQFKIL